MFDGLYNKVFPDSYVHSIGSLLLVLPKLKMIDFENGEPAPWDHHHLIFGHRMVPVYRSHQYMTPESSRLVHYACQLLPGRWSDVLWTGDQKLNIYQRNGGEYHDNIPTYAMGFYDNCRALLSLPADPADYPLFLATEEVTEKQRSYIDGVLRGAIPRSQYEWIQ